MAEKTPIFDAHHHLWDLDRCHYPWLEARGQRRFFGDPTPIQCNYLAEDLLRDAQAYELVGSTHIQVGTVEEDSLKETEFVQQIADTTANIGNAIIAYVDLTRNDVAQLLDRHGQSTNFRGVRQIIGRHPIEDAKTGSANLLAHPMFHSGLALLASRGLTFDLQLTEANYSDAAKLFANISELQFAICHFASPWDLTREGFARWQGAMERFARLPGAHMKFSGFGMFKPDWTVEDIEPYINHALKIFGEDRCFAGTNFPVDKLYGQYGRIWDALAKIVGTGRVFQKITLENAQRFYRA